MLIPRILTAIILILLVIAGIFYLPPLWFKIIVTLLIFLAAWELATLFWPLTIPIRIIFILVSLIIFLTLEFTYPILGIACGAIWWVIAPYFLTYYTKNETSLLSGEIAKWLTGILVFIPCLLSLIELRFNFGSKYLLYILVVIWAVDIGGYFGGKFFGKRKLAPKISPKKTIEGLWSSLILAFIVAIAGNLLINYPHFNWSLLLLTIVASLWSVIGDLLESMLKRQAQVKDSGHLLPGHGGIYDRIDSLTAALPIFTLGMFLIG